MSISTNRRVRGARPASKPSTSSKRFRSRHPVLSALAPVVLVLAVIATMVIVKATSNSSASTAPASPLPGGKGAAASSDPGTAALAPTVAASLSVPAATLDRVGQPASVLAPNATGDSGPILRAADGKPVVAYIGAEYCPYCAAERWAIAVALSRFGTFSNLSATHSTSNDVYPDTQTLSFYGSQYTSAYLDFQPVEEATNQAVDGAYPTLQRPTTEQSNLLARFDQEGSIPFLDIGNKYVVVGASFSPQVLAGLSQAQIAQQLDDPSSAVAQAIDGAANELTAAICQVTGQQPSSVASSPVIASIAKSLGA